MQRIRQKYKQVTSTPTGKIIFFSILALILAALAGGLIYWQIHKKQIIRNELEHAIHGKSNGLYNVQYASLDLDEIGGYLSIKQMTINYDSSRYLSMAKQDNAPPILLKIRLPEITVSGVKTPKALIDKEIEGTKLELKNPEIELIYTLQGKDSSRSVPDREIYEQILGNLNLISIDTVLISGAHIRTSHLKTGKTNMEFTNASIELFNVRVDSTADADTSRLFFAKAINAGCEDAVYATASGLYNYRIKNIYLNSDAKTVTAGNFMVDPKLAENAFVKSLPTQDDRFDFSLKDITVKNIDFTGLMQENVFADSILVKEASFKIYRDLNIKRDTKNRVGTYPHQAIAKIPIPVNVKKIVLTNTFVEYKEKNAITKESGKVQFHNVYAVITNLTNKKEQLDSNNKMTADITCRFMDKAPFRATWLFYLENQHGRFDLNGNMGSMDATDLNVLTEPMGPARIENGSIKSVSFNLAGSDYSMGGSVKVLYNDLKVALLERDKGSKEMDKKALTSFVANILIKNANPAGKNKNERIANVTYKRDTNRSIFNMAWKTLFQGIKETVGIKK